MNDKNFTKKLVSSILIATMCLSNFSWGRPAGQKYLRAPAEKGSTTVQKVLGDKKNAEIPVNNIDEETKLKLRTMVEEEFKEVLFGKVPPGAINYRAGFTDVMSEKGLSKDGEKKIKQALEHLHLATKKYDIRIQHEIHAQGEFLLATLKNHTDLSKLTTLQFEGVANRLVKKISSNSDAYKEYKEKLDADFLKIYDNLRDKILKNPDNQERLFTAIVYAGIGNLLDLSHPKALKEIREKLGIEIDSPDTAIVEDVYQQIIGKNLFITSSDKDFQKSFNYIMERKGGWIPYFVDNHGEFVVDEIVFEVLLKLGFKVAVVARGETARDDITFEEATSIISENKYLKGYLDSGQLKVLTDGSYLLGADLSQSYKQPEFLDVWKKAIFYFSKGAGNFQTLLGPKGQKFALPGFHIRALKGSQNALDKISELINSKIEIANKELKDYYLVMVYHDSVPSEVANLELQKVNDERKKFVIRETNPKIEDEELIATLGKELESPFTHVRRQSAETIMEFVLGSSAEKVKLRLIALEAILPIVLPDLEKEILAGGRECEGELDLHTHTNKVDGYDTYTRHLYLALLRGLKGIAITDHDLLPEEEADQAAKIINKAIKKYNQKDKKKINIPSLIYIPGIEITTFYAGVEIHVLTYLPYWHLTFFKQKKKELQKIINKLDELTKMMKTGVENLADEWNKMFPKFPITMEAIKNSKRSEIWISSMLTDKVFELYKNKLVTEGLISEGDTSKQLWYKIARPRGLALAYSRVTKKYYLEWLEMLDFSRITGALIAFGHPSEIKENEQESLKDENTEARKIINSYENGILEKILKIDIPQNIKNGLLKSGQLLGFEFLHSHKMKKAMAKKPTEEGYISGENLAGMLEDVNKGNEYYKEYPLLEEGTPGSDSHGAFTYPIGFGKNNYAYDKERYSNQVINAIFGRTLEQAILGSIRELEKAKTLRQKELAKQISEEIDELLSRASEITRSTYDQMATKYTDLRGKIPNKTDQKMINKFVKLLEEWLERNGFILVAKVVEWTDERVEKMLTAFGKKETNVPAEIKKMTDNTKQKQESKIRLYLSSL